MKMNKTVNSLLLPAIILALLLVGQVVAQSGYSVNDQIAKLKTELNLDQAQSRKVAILLIKMDEKQTEINERLSDNSEARRKAYRRSRQKLNDEMKLILDQDQFEKFQKMNLRSPSDRTARQIKSLTDALSLTEQQTEKVQAVYDKYQPEMDQIFQSFRGGGSDANRQANRIRIGEIREKMSADISALLTEEQVEKYKKYQEENRSRGRNWGRQGGHQGGR